MHHVDAIQIADCPDDFYGRQSGRLRCDVLNRRLTRWLLEREMGIAARRQQENSQVKFIPKTPDEQAAWRARTATNGKRRPPSYVTYDSAAAAYIGRPRGRKRSPKHAQESPATTTANAQAAMAGVGEAGTYTPAPDRRPEVGAQAKDGKRSKPLPSGDPAHTTSRRRARSTKSFRLENLSTVILHQLGLD